MHRGLISAQSSQQTNAGHTIVAFKKSDLYQGTYQPTYFHLTNAVDRQVWTIQPAVDFDSPAGSNYAWFVAKGPPAWNVTNYQGGAVYYRRLWWEGSTPRLDTEWATNTGWNQRDYYDLDGTNITLTATNGVFAPDPGANQRIALYLNGSRLTPAVIRDGYLWTCQTVGLMGANGSYTNDPSGASVDRSAVQWLKFQVNAEAGTLAYVTNGLIYDHTALSNAMYYNVPSLMVNGAGDMVVGFSGSSANSHIGAYYMWRLANGLIVDPPDLLWAGSVAYDGLNQWGDYSATVIDPTDGAIFWTIQAYADSSQKRLYPRATVVAKIRPKP